MYNTIIVGSGIAGLSAAITLRESGKSVAVLSKTYPTKSQSCMAQGGINAVLSGEKKGVDSHVEDTLRVSYGEAQEENIRFVCEKGAETISWLDRIGVPFSRNKEGKIAQRKLGAAKDYRACFAQDYTGLKILHTLFDYAIKIGVEFFYEKFLVEILQENKKAYGVAVVDIKSSEVECFYANSIILATGGYAGLYRGYTTNSSQATGETLIIAKNAGCELKNLEFVQFHPTALKSSKVLISESARGEGGHLLDNDKKRFIDELLPRDVISREIYERTSKGENVYLDIRHLGEVFIDENLPQERKLAKIFEGVDPVEELIPIEPAAHYSMGGIKSGVDCRSSLEGLFVCGECAEAGVHGANRLGGNSLLEAVVLGREAGKAASLQKEENIREIESTFAIEGYFQKTGNENLYGLREMLGKVLIDKVGIIRNKKNLSLAIENLEEIKKRAGDVALKDKGRIYNTNLIDMIEFGFGVELALEIAKSALSREKSVGAHYIRGEDEI